MKKLIPMLALAIMMSACVKPQPKTPCFSILGDSYSSYEGYVYPETNDVYPYDAIGMTSVEQMWWHKVAAETGWNVEQNNSFSGALVCNFDDFSSGSYYAPYSFLRRMNDLGQPDVIFVFGATNDACAHDEGNEPVVPLGDYVYSDWTEEQLCAFRPALSYLFDNLRQKYPQAKLYFLLDMNLGSGGVTEERRAAFIESIHHISSHYNVTCIDLMGIQKSQWHPNAQGQETIARQVIEALQIDFNV